VLELSPTRPPREELPGACRAEAHEEGEEVRTFVIGDVHGHIDRLVALLQRAQVATCLNQDPTAEWFINPNVEVVQLGDLGQFSPDTHQKDLLCWRVAERLKFTVLWGNHDYANIDPENHSFRGWDPAHPELREVMERVRPVFATERNGYLLTHAGLHPAFLGPPEFPLELLAGLINECPQMAVVNAINIRRGGSAEQGGVLWRDDSEALANIPQVYGHSRGLIRRHGPSWCIDVAGRDDPGDLAGLWLDSKEIVAVGPDAGIHETPWEDSE
jgi:hypothetical protein